MGVLDTIRASKNEAAVAAELALLKELDSMAGDAVENMTWIPAIQAMQSGSKAVKAAQAEAQKTQKPSAVNAGDFVLGKTVLNQYDPNTGERKPLYIFPLAFRQTALYFEGSKVTMKSYDSRSDEFKEIRNKPKTKNGGPKYGPEILLWLPEFQKIATFHFAASAFNAGVTVCHGKPHGHIFNMFSDEQTEASNPWHLTDVSLVTDQDLCNTLMLTQPTEALYNKMLHIFENPQVYEEKKASKEETEKANARKR